MKIGIVIPNYYLEYLEKIANLNHISKSSVCGLIVENFLSYNLNFKKFPSFQKSVRIVFGNESIKSDSNNFGSPFSPGNVHETGKHSSGDSPVDRDSIIEQLSLVPDDPEDGFPFDFEPED